MPRATLIGSLILAGALVAPAIADEAELLSKPKAEQDASAAPASSAKQTLADSPPSEPPAEPAAQAPAEHAPGLLPQQDGKQAEMAAVRGTSQAFTDAFNNHDAKAVAQLWTADGEFVDDEGDRLVGRDAIEKAYAEFFATHGSTKLKSAIENIRMLSDCAAMEDGHTILDPPPPGAPAIGQYTAVHVKIGDHWLMSSVREKRIELPSNFKHVADMEWLIGEWTAEEQGNTMNSVCTWVADKSFVERSYTVTRIDGSTTSGVQLIGWNPRENKVQSWNFSSDGGHAVGVWTPQPGGWSAEVRGVTGDGVPSTAVNVLRKLDDNAYMWQSTHRMLGGITIPDTDEIVLKRKVAGH